MARLRDRMGREVELGRRHVVGRAPSCDLRLESGDVSGIHASIWWDGTRWLVRDLGSRNGTWLDGQRLASGEDAPLAAAARLGFGKTPDGWTVVDLDPPGAGSGLDRTAPAAADTVDTIGLRFDVSLDEEHVHLWMQRSDQLVDLGSRSHNNLLLLLARARLEDQGDEAIPASAHGWLYQDEAARGLGVTEGQLNLLVFRARKQLAGLSIGEADRLVERRIDAGQIRLGVARLDVRKV